LFTGKENPTNIKGAFKADVNKLKNRKEQKKSNLQSQQVEAVDINLEQSNIVAENEEIIEESKTDKQSTNETK